VSTVAHLRASRAVRAICVEIPDGMLALPGNLRYGTLVLGPRPLLGRACELDDLPARSTFILNGVPGGATANCCGSSRCCLRTRRDAVDREDDVAAQGDLRPPTVTIRSPP